MKDSILIELIKSLQKKEIREFRKFLKSPFFNQREDVVLLFEVLIQECFQSKIPELEKEKIFPKVYPNEIFSDKKIRYLMSFLLKNLRKFLSYQEFASREPGEQLALVENLRKRNLNRPFKVEWEKLNQLIKVSNIQNADFQLTNFRLQSNFFQHNIKQARAEIKGFKESNQYLTNYFIAQQIKMACYAASLKTVLGKGLEDNFLPYILEELQKNDYSNIPSIAVYHLCYRALTEENSTILYGQLRELVLQYHTAFPTQELQEIYGYILNYFIRRINEGGEEFKQNAFEVYQEGLELGVFFENGQLSRFHYKNIVASGLGLQKLNWVRNFIETYRDKLEKKYRESTYAFNLALWYYKQNDYQQAMIWLQKVGSDDVLNNLNARRILLRTYYDLGEFDALESLLDSFRNYIYRRRDLGYQKELYLNLIKYTRRLLSLDFYNKSAKEQLKKEIEKAPRLAERVWLLTKLN